MKLAAACLLLIVGAAAAEPKAKSQPTRVSGKVVKTSSKISPGGDGKPVFREGRLTMTDKADREEELKATAKTKITLDGKPAPFRAAQPGTIIVRAQYDPNTKELSALDLKSAPRPESPSAEEPGVVTGEVADTDVIKGRLSVRLGPQNVREYAVGDATEVVGADGKAVAFETLKVGDPVEVDSKDGKTAAAVRARPAK